MKDLSASKMAVAAALLLAAIRCGAAPACKSYKAAGYTVSGCGGALAFAKKDKKLASLSYSDSLAVHGARAFSKKGSQVLVVDLEDGGARRLEFFSLHGKRVSPLGQVPTAPADADQALAGVDMKPEGPAAMLFDFKTKVGKLGPDGGFLEMPGARVRISPRAKPLAGVLGVGAEKPLGFELVAKNKK